MNSKIYDVVIIGAGQAGVPLASSLADAGWQVALAERKTLGGSCVNFGCTPTKAVMGSARVVHLARKAGEFGLQVGEVGVDFPAVLERARKMVQKSVDGLETVFSENPRLMRGHATLEGKDGEYFVVRVGQERVKAKKVVLNPGTRSSIPPIEGIEKLDLITADNWLEFDTLPEHLLLLGGGYIGLEMAQFYRRMGAQVTLIEHGSRLLEREDPEVSEGLKTMLEREGVTLHLSSKALKVEKTAGGLALELEGKTILQGSHLLVAAGRKPNTHDMGLESVGLDGSKVLECSDTLECKVPGIFLSGDIRPGLQLTSTSYDDFRILENQFVGDGSRTTQRTVPYAIWTDPELARVGLNELEAQKQGLEYKVARLEAGKIARGQQDGNTGGFVKILVNPQTEEILGATLFMAHAGDLIHLLSSLMILKAPYTLVRDAVLTHPSYTEGLQKAFMALKS